ncbi:hypothetical protein H5J25_10520 [Sphingomonas aliaeris]|uniref:Uncharacterized protein n=1 Tax=Sphingomonas aliaeris TaxID=2759526 RepID=A0A974NSB5_9SPHN|nr:hypothetical protein [Sphingomonas aliaeris]QQV76008.1 hypothetical protein H5J25_10520 [Sphingomonas aliaeris]
MKSDSGMAAAGSLTLSRAGAAIAAVMLASCGQPTAGAAAATLDSKIGVSAVPASYYGTERIWANLAYRASEWMTIVGGLNQYGNPNTAGRIFLQAPNDVLLGKATRITCTWQGNGAAFVNGSVPNWVKSDTRTISFVWQPAGPPGKHGGVWFDLSGSDGTFRDLDCREPGVVANGRLDQRYVDDMKLYSVVRFLDWSTANSNAPITWATRALPNQQRSGTFTGDQPLEDQIEIANAIGGDAWFTIPWNADDDYIRRMATLIRDTLKGKAYFETGNEVWNWMFKVTGQAQAEGEAANLAGSGNKWDNMFLRYAQKTIEQNKIVTDVFKAQPNRLVRVASFQSGNTVAMNIFLRYPDTINWVDAFADAPYFGVNDLNTTTRYTGTQADLFAKVEVERKKSISLTSNIAAAAKKLGKLSMIYEGGNGTISSEINADINEEMQRSPLMEAAYDRYLADLRAVHTGPIMLYNSTGPTSRFGSWGQHEFTGQPEAVAPKRRAIAKAVARR